MDWGKGYDGEGEEGKTKDNTELETNKNQHFSFLLIYSSYFSIFAEDETENLEQDFKTSEDRCIFLIDARKAMFEKNRSGEIHIINSMKVALEVMKTKIISSEKSSIAVIFFGTKNATPGLNSTDGIYTLFSLDFLPKLTKKTIFVVFGCLPTMMHPTVMTRLWYQAWFWHAKIVGNVILRPHYGI